MQIPIHHIRTDGGTQPRLHLDLATVAEYVEAMSDGATFPPVTVFYDGANYWLADGFHRTSAAQQLGIAEITADVRQGTLQDAQWHSYSVNQAHGLRRTNEDKRRAVEAALSHPFHAKYSNREIARHIGVTPEYISRMATSIDRSIDRSDTRIVTRNGTTYEMNTANIGARPNFTTPFVPTATDYADFYGDDEPWPCPTGLFGHMLSHLVSHVHHTHDNWANGMVYWAHQQLHQIATLEDVRAAVEAVNPQPRDTLATIADQRPRKH